MNKIFCYPELPPTYRYRQPGEWGTNYPDDIDIMLAESRPVVESNPGGMKYRDALVAWIFVDLHHHQHKVKILRKDTTAVSIDVDTIQDGLNLLTQRLWLGMLDE